MGTWAGRVGFVWLATSLVIMVVLSSFVFVGSRRKRMASDSPRYLTFDSARVVPLNRGRGDHAAEHDVDGVDGDPHGASSPVIRHQITASSGALDRLLAGVQMPCGLVRLYVEGEDESQRMAFQTFGFDAREVAVSVVDELERMGMDIEPLSYTEARAFRDGLELAVSIYAEPNRVIRNRRLAFPGTDPTGIVIEFSVV
ncbi:MAG: hypothetical protein ACKV2O_09590 [Acidimicrobiales bacterium]